MKKRIVAVIFALLCLITFTCCGENPVAEIPFAEKTMESQEPDFSENENTDVSDDKSGDTDEESDGNYSDNETENVGKEEGDGLTLRFELTADGTGYVVSGIVGGEYEVVEIPDSYEGLPVTEIKAYAFAGAKIKRAIISASVIKIGERAFDGTNVEEVAFAVKDGWKIGDRLVSSSILENEKFAAKYLGITFSKYEWKRTENENGEN